MVWLMALQFTYILPLLTLNRFLLLWLMLAILFIFSASVRGTWSIVSFLLTRNFINHCNYSELELSFLFYFFCLVQYWCVEELFQLWVCGDFYWHSPSKKAFKGRTSIVFSAIYYAVMFCKAQVIHFFNNEVELFHSDFMVLEPASEGPLLYCI